jgi:hypothetical protein
MEKENKRYENNHRHRRGFPTPLENRLPAGLGKRTKDMKTSKPS